MINLKERILHNKTNFPLNTVNKSMHESIGKTNGIRLFEEKFSKHLGKNTAPFIHHYNCHKKKQINLPESCLDSPQISECVDIFIKNSYNKSKFYINLRGRKC
jgi:hypothetical protein